MSRELRILAITLVVAFVFHAAPVSGQEEQQPPPTPADGFRRGPDGRGGPPMQGEIKLVQRFDEDGDKRLSTAERKAAREFLNKERAEGRLGGRGRGPRGGGPRGPGPGANFPVPGPQAESLERIGPPPGGEGAPPDPGGRFGGRGGPRDNQPPPSPGVKLAPADVRTYRAMPLYDLQTLRTFFLEFENADWERELIDFHGTDVEVPARLMVDGKTYDEVGVYFRGASSFGVGEGRKHSINLSMDFADEDQRLGGYRTFNLLNSSGDPTLMRAVLYHQIAREYIPSPKANWVRVAINGESWGIYVNIQQFNKDFVEEWFGKKKGARWKAPGRPNGNSGLEFLGEDVAEYKKRYEIKSKDEPESWEALIELCRVLGQTPAEQLEEQLAPILDIDGVLKFLALENVFINTDGYWTRASDYSLYRDEKGRFHIIPHDVNETFRAAGGPGMRGPGGRGGPGDARDANNPRDRGNPSAPPSPGGPVGPGTPNAGGAPTRPDNPDGSSSPGSFVGPPGPGSPVGPGGGRGRGAVELDPFAGADDPKKPLLSKLLAVPSLRARYLGYVREIAETWLDWGKLGPIVQQYQTFLAQEVKADTRKLGSYEAFISGVAGETAEQQPQRGRGGVMSLKRFADERRTYLLAHPEIQKLSATVSARSAQN